MSLLKVFTSNVWKRGLEEMVLGEGLRYEHLERVRVRGPPVCFEAES